MSEERIERELGWEDEIENEGGFVLLPEGDYDFRVTDFERGRYAGGKKLPPCNMATLYLAVTGPEGTATVRHNLFLHTKCEGLLCAFFTAIGQRRHGEKLQMNWGRVKGATGRCRLGVRSWTNEKGEEYTSNEVKKFYDPQEKPKFTPGAF